MRFVCTLTNCVTSLALVGTLSTSLPVHHSTGHARAEGLGGYAEAGYRNPVPRPPIPKQKLQRGEGKESKKFSPCRLDCGTSIAEAILACIAERRRLRLGEYYRCLWQDTGTRDGDGDNDGGVPKNQERPKKQKR